MTESYGNSQAPGKLFSIVMAVYNVEKYLEEAFQSLLNQTIGTEAFEVILVDDGSTDQSGAICDRLQKAYPDFVKTLHQENGGQGKARNLGMQAASGRYINFMDSDDCLSPDTLELTALFFREHEHETDVAAIPIIFFDAAEGEHWQNDRFQERGYVLNLKNDYCFMQASASNAFFVRQQVREIRFDEQMKYAEDTKYALMCISRLETIGLVSGCSYRYRRRSEGGSSTQNLAQNPNWQKRWMEQYEFWALDYFTRNGRTLPRWVQYALLCHLWNRIEVDRKAKEITQTEDYLERLRQVAVHIDDEIFSRAKMIDPADLLLIKRISAPEKKIEIREQNGEMVFRVGEITLSSLRQTQLYLDEVSAENHAAEVSGRVCLYPDSPMQDFFLAARTKDEECRAEFTPLPEMDAFCGRLLLKKAWRFHVSVSSPAEAYQIQFFWKCPKPADQEIPAAVNPGCRMPVLQVKHSTGWTGGWKYILSSSGISMIPCAGRLTRIKRELLWEKVLLQHGQWGAFRDRMQYYFLKAGHKVPEWFRKAEGKQMDELDEKTRWNADLLYRS